jgi:uncharacterized protein YeaO (DUF488 family)
VGVKTARAYSFAKRKKKRNEYAVLVDRVWPRGIKKSELDYDEWIKDVAPSSDLRKWFGHREDRWEEFQQRYKDELKDKDEAVRKLADIAGQKDLVLLYGTKNERMNQAKVLRDVIGS